MTLSPLVIKIAYWYESDLALQNRAYQILRADAGKCHLSLICK